MTRPPHPVAECSQPDENRLIMRLVFTGRLTNLGGRVMTRPYDCVSDTVCREDSVQKGGLKSPP